jgi:hypothetical protein
VLDAEHEAVAELKSASGDDARSAGMKRGKKWMALALLVVAAATAGCAMTPEEIEAQWAADHPEGLPRGRFNSVGSSDYHMDSMRLGIPRSSY